jgi:hypothetical protein
MDKVDRELQEMWIEDFERTGFVLRQLCKRARTLDPVPSSMVWKLLHCD